MSLALYLALNTSTHLIADEANQRQLLLTRLQWVRFDLVLGRVHATTNRTDQSRRQATDNGPSGQEEKLFVSVDQGLISLRYQSIAPTESLHVEVVRRGAVQVRLTRQAQASSPKLSVVYTQPHRGDVTLEIAKHEQPRRKIQAASLWHLLLAYPDECGEYLVPTLELLRPNWNVEQERREILTHLRQIRLEQYTVSQTEVVALVEQLNDSRFRVRQLADRQLRAAGPCALFYLDTIDFDLLGTEQRERVEKIRAAIEARTIDAPACVAARLSHDKSVWITLLGHDDAEMRVVAKRQLSHLCQHDIDFDPTAGSDQRAQQLANLQSQLLRR